MNVLRASTRSHFRTEELLALSTSESLSSDSSPAWTTTQLFHALNGSRYINLRLLLTSAHTEDITDFSLGFRALLFFNHYIR